MRSVVFAIALAACAQPADKSAAPPPAAEVEAPASTATQSTEAALATMPSWEAARAAGVDFRAVGQEPGWMLDIHVQGPIVLLWDYGANRFEFPAAEPTYPQEGATRYESSDRGHTLVVTTRRFPCQDAMSGQAYPAAVDVVIDGRTLTGCGKSV